MRVGDTSLSNGKTEHHLDMKSDFRCYACGDENFSLWYLNIDGFSLWRCCNCGSAKTLPTPEPEELKRVYSKEYYKQRIEESEIDRRMSASEDIFLALLIQLESAQSGRRLLDVGCSYGFFLDKARARGWYSSGIELSEPAADYARNILGLDVTTDELETVIRQGKTYDVITMWHVLEHLPDPERYLRNIAEILDPGGLIALRVPNVDSLSRKILGKGWPWFLKGNYHLHHFSAKGLSTILKRADFEVGYLATQRGDYPYSICTCCAIALIQKTGLYSFIKNHLCKEKPGTINKSAGLQNNHYRIVNPIIALLEGIDALIQPVYKRFFSNQYGDEIIVFAYKKTNGFHQD